jgi:hypothetical protein
VSFAQSEHHLQILKSPEVREFANELRLHQNPLKRQMFPIFHILAAAGASAAGASDAKSAAP